jgi:hypothetical protein
LEKGPEAGKFEIRNSKQIRKDRKFGKSEMPADTRHRFSANSLLSRIVSDFGFRICGPAVTAMSFLTLPANLQLLLFVR